MSDKILPFAPWCAPKERRIYANGRVTVYCATAYGYHAIAAFLYGAWRWMRGDTFWKDVTE